MCAAQELGFHHPADLEPQLIIIEGLGQVILRAGLHSVDRDSLRAIGRDHQDGSVGLKLADMLEQLQPVHPLHAEVGDDDVEEAGLELFERLLARIRGLYLIAFLGEEPLERDHDSALVVDD